MVSKSTIGLWYDGTALDAAKFYAETFPDSAVEAVHRVPGDYAIGVNRTMPSRASLRWLASLVSA